MPSGGKQPHRDAVRVTNGVEGLAPADHGRATEVADPNAVDETRVPESLGQDAELPVVVDLTLEPVDGSQNGQFALDVEFDSPSYAKSMRGNLLMFKPAIVSRRSSVFLTEAKRTHPVVLNAEAYNETVKIKLPANFVVDEIPEGAEINQPFGKAPRGNAEIARLHDNARVWIERQNRRGIG